MKTTLMVIGLALTLSGCGDPQNTAGTPTLKTIEQLSPTERTVLNRLTVDLYKSVSGGQTCFTYQDTFFSKPREDGSYEREQLDKPLTLISYACIGPFMLDPRTLQRLRESIASIRARWSTTEGGPTYTMAIAESFLFPNPGGAGGTLYSSNEKVTIVPIGIAIVKE